MEVQVAGENPTTDKSIRVDLGHVPVKQARPAGRTVRTHVEQEAQGRSTVLGLVVLTAALSLYALAIAGVIASPWWPLQIVCGFFAGCFIGTLFIVGHDACHDSLTPNSTLNRIVGRIAFLPSLTPYTSWKFAHNQVHHTYTNWRQKDYAWAPLTKPEFDKLPKYRQFLERHYRTFAGFARHYLLEYWLPRLLFPSVQDRNEMQHSAKFELDRCLVLLFGALQVAAAVTVSQYLSPTAGFWGAWTSPVALVLLTVVLPFDIWCGAMGFATFQQHNHPRLAWYDDREEWDFFAAHVEGTVHMQMPVLLEWTMGFIMQHTAHHVNPKVPLYRLTAAQDRLEAAYAEHIIVERWSLSVMSRNTRLCKLYDYENHCWLDFDGNPTTEPNPVLKKLRALRAETPFDATLPVARKAG